MPNVDKLFLLTALLVSAILTAGCGVKAWPEPKVQEERFVWKNITFSAQSTCLNIQATLDGAFSNLSRVVLEVAPADEDCPSCPFVARHTISFEMDAPEITYNGASLSLRCCQLPETTGYRWRLVGYNVHNALQPVISHVMYAHERNPL